MNVISDNRIGRFSIPHHIIANRPDAVATMMGKMVVIRAESIYGEDRIEYCAYSELFLPIKKGYRIPEYNIVYTDGDITAEAIDAPVSGPV